MPRKRPSKPLQLLDESFATVLIWLTLAYFLISILLAALLGPFVSGLVGTALWGVAAFVIAKWDALRKRKNRTIALGAIQFPRLRIRHIATVVVAINSLMVATGYVIGRLDSLANPRDPGGAPRSFGELFNAAFDAPLSYIQMVLLGVAAYFVGGLLSAWLLRYQARGQYALAAVSAAASLGINFFILVILGLVFNLGLEPPDDADVPLILAVNMVFPTSSLLGARVRSRFMHRGGPVSALPPEQVGVTVPADPGAEQVQKSNKRRRRRKRR
jgi:hypothetical protein